MGNDISASALSGGAIATLPAAEPPPRYDFAAPAHSVADLLAVQLAECVRVVRALSDQATDPRLADYERTPAIHALDNVIGSSTNLAREIGRIENGTPDVEAAPNARRKMRDS